MQAIADAKASEITFNEALLRLAAVHGRLVRFRYAKTNTAPIEDRQFVPEGVYSTRDGNVVIVGQDDDREGTRSYRLDRIKGEVTL